MLDERTLPILGATFLLLGVERLVEIGIHRRHVEWLRARGAILEPRDGFGLILAGQVLLFALVPAEAALAPWAGVGWWTWPMLGVAALAQALRYWVIATLGQRWAIRVVTLPGAPRIATGPYRFLSHPNYLAVALEALALPIAFGAWGALAVVLPLTLVALARRIRIEERALRAAAAKA